MKNDIRNELAVCGFEAVKALVERRTVLQDVSKVEDYECKVLHTRYMANVAGFGFDAKVNLKYNELKDEGKYSKRLYLRSTLKTLLAYKSNRYIIKANGVEYFNGVAFSGAVGIGKFNGGGMQQTPNATVDDGLMDLTIIKKMSKFSVLRKFRLLYSGEIYSLPSVIYKQCSSIEIFSNPFSRVEIDGEAVGESPLKFTVVPRSVRVLVGSSYKI